MAPSGGPVQTKSVARVLGSQLRGTMQPVPQLMDSPMSTLRKLADIYTRLPYSPLDPLRAFLSNPDFDEYILAQ
ncbi:hypothetical protein FRC11_012870, partial [Ceratobasidium sp. 423]